MIPVQFISSEANYSARKVLMELLEAGVTYIMDRGYLAFDIFQKLTEKQAFFITRIRYTVRASIQTALEVDIPNSVRHAYWIDKIISRCSSVIG